MKDQPKAIHLIGIVDKDGNHIIAGTVNDPLEAINSPKLKEAADRLEEQEKEESKKPTK
jgi:hypothetical protein